MKKRFVSVLLAITMCASLCAMEASAENQIIMTADEFVTCCKRALNRTTSYNNVYPKNLGYYDGNSISWDCWNMGKSILWSRGAIVDNYEVGHYQKSDTTIGLGDWTGGYIVCTASTPSTDFSNIEIGEWLYMSSNPHVGYYVGGRNVIECTVQWGISGVTTSQVGSDGTRSKNGVVAGKWTHHAKVPWIDYSVKDTYITSFNNTAEPVNDYYCLAPGKNPAAVRSSPNVDGSAVGYLGSGEIIHVSKKGYNGKGTAYWYYIDTGTFAGCYIYSENVQVTTAPPINFTQIRGVSNEKYSVDTHTATVVTVVTSDVLSTLTCTKSGIRLYDDTGTRMLTEYYNDYSASPVINDKIYISYEMKDEVGYPLTPDTKYYYRFYVIINGKGYWSEPYDFTTNSDTHSHSYGDWVKDDTNHWRECSCGAKTDMAAHSYGDWTTTTAVTCTTNGSRYRVCTTCGYQQTETISAPGHSFSSRWRNDGSNHWQECYCGAKTNISAHSYGGWTVSTEATHTADGSKYRTCSICGYQQTETIPATGHSYSSAWRSDDTNHWHECSCGARSSTAAHSYGGWKTTTAATCDTDGSRYHTCTVCGYTQTDPIPATGHSYSSAWKSDDTNHWHECSCGDINNVSPHIYGLWTITSPENHIREGSKYRTCKVCGYKYTEIIPTTPDHNFGTTWEFDIVNHWHKCACGVTADIEEHSFVNGICSVCGCSGKCGENLFFSLKDGKLTVFGIGEMPEMLYPDDYPWFSDRNSIKTVEIKPGVTSIERGAFHYCSNLTSVTIPSSVTSIGDAAFDSCESLTSVTIPSSVTSIGDYAFYSCESLTSVTIPSSVVSIGAYAFSECSNLLSAAISDGVENIGKYAFANCEKLLYFAFSPSVTSISYNAFSGCNSLTDGIHFSGTTDEWYDLDSSVTEALNSYLFSSTPRLTGATFAGIMSWNLDVNTGVLTISGDGAMGKISKVWEKEKDKIQTVVINQGVTSINYEAFSNCSNLGDFTIPDSVTVIGQGAFEECSSLTDVYYDGTEEQWNALKKNIETYNDSLLNATVHFSKVHSHTYDKQVMTDTYLASAATCTEAAKYYYSCECGEKGSQTFTYGDPLGHNYVGGECTRCHEPDPSVVSAGICGDNVYWMLDKEGVLTVTGTAKMTEFLFSSDVPWYDNRNSIKTVEIEQGVTSIGNYAFFDCSNLTSVTIPAGVTSIGEGAFYGCSSLTSVAIPTSVVSIGNHAFGSTPWQEAKGEFAVENGILFAYQGIGGAVTIPEDVTSIGEGVFWACDSLTSITIPNGVTSIGEYAFEDCTSLMKIYIPLSVTSIGEQAFWRSTNLTGVYYGGTEEQWNALKKNIETYNAPLLNAVIHFNTTASADGVLVVEKKLEGNTVAFNYAFDTQKTGTGTVCAAQYVEGRMTGIKTIEVDLSAASGKAEFTDEDGAVYKIILVDANAAPACAAWQMKLPVPF